jgi:hypothetical protein
MPTVPADVQAEFGAWLDDYDANLRKGLDAYFGLEAAKAGGHVDPDNARPPRMPIADDITEADVQHIAWQIIEDAIDRGEAPPTRIRTVPIGDLIATQRVVDDERVDDDAADYRVHGQGDQMPFVIEWRDGKFYILAGHHHTEGALDEGATEMRVQELYPKADD